MQSLVLAGNFRELTNEELYEVNGGWIAEWWNRASGPERGTSAVVGAGGGAVLGSKTLKGAKIGAKIGSLAGPIGFVAGGIAGGAAAAVIFTVFY